VQSHRREPRGQQTAIPEGVVVVTDALDECDDGNTFRSSSFVTSRPQPTIREKMLAWVLAFCTTSARHRGMDLKKKISLRRLEPPPSPDNVECLANVRKVAHLYGHHSATTVRRELQGLPADGARNGLGRPNSITISIIYLRVSFLQLSTPSASKSRR